MNQRTGANYGNINPKLRKKHKTLKWAFDPNRPDTADQKSCSNSPLKRRFPQGKRFASNTLRYSQKMGGMRSAHGLSNAPSQACDQFSGQKMYPEATSPSIAQSTPQKQVTMFQGGFRSMSNGKFDSFQAGPDRQNVS